MKTFCAVSGGVTRVFSADYVCEIEPAVILMHEKAVQKALAHSCPVSVKVAWGWVTQNRQRIPRSIGQTSYIIVRSLCQA